MQNPNMAADYVAQMGKRFSTIPAGGTNAGGTAKTAALMGKKAPKLKQTIKKMAAKTPVAIP